MYNANVQYNIILALHTTPLGQTKMSIIERFL